MSDLHIQDKYNDLVQVNLGLYRDVERLTAENARLTMMLTEYVRLDNAGKIPIEPVGGAALQEVSDGD